MERGDRRHLRAWPRLKIFQPVEMRRTGSTVRGHLLNLSGGGALAYCDDPPGVGTAIVLTLGQIEHTASVVWRDGRRFGVAFRLGISDAEIRRVIDAESVRRVAAVSR